ncbi:MULTISPECIES: sulfurtransferase [Arthrobacter]|uniref:Sulfurtransferase n=2 Tax=Arthrobacter TaxID=1663 RepID=A0ABU9KQM5_9MICC|nr:sulfurtransferase [Arthrobacter sp. YJM1]MDP5228414.1 sulfurtransferase [Arthrobacter sp. YJM1]
MEQEFPVTIAPADVHDLDPDKLVILDVRWTLGDPLGREKYLMGHLPAAVFVDMESDLAAPASPEAGRHPLPSFEDFQATARRWGINDGDTVVVYDNSGSMAAARAWWLLREFGHADTRILDGGLMAWVLEDFSIEKEDVTLPAGDVTLHPMDPSAVVGIDGAGTWPENGVLLDARATERYRGEVEPIDPRAGHIPGAISAPTTENVDEDGQFLSAEALRERFSALGVEPGTPVAVYCGSGVTAAHEVAALKLAGFDAVLYPGSFSQWSNDASRDVATGA